jgi:hypothetical protein
MEPIKMLLDFVAKAYGMTEAAAAELLTIKSEEGALTLKNEALNALLEQDKKRIEKLKSDVDKTQIFDDAFAKATDKINGKIEKKLVEKFGIKTDGKQLSIDEIIVAIAEKKAEKGDLTEDIVKAHPTYIAMENAKANELNAVKSEFETKLKEIEKTERQKSVFSSVEKAALKHFNALNPVLSTDQVKAENQRKRFLQDFKDYEFEPIEGAADDFVIIKNGKRLENAHAQRITLADLVKQNAETQFDFAKQTEKQNAGVVDKAGNPLKVPTNKDEFEDAIFAAKTAEERTQIRETYIAAGGTVD